MDSYGERIDKTQNPGYLRFYLESYNTANTGLILHTTIRSVFKH